MDRKKVNFFESISPKNEAYIEIFAKTSLFFSMYRYENKLTQAQLAKKLGITQAMVSKLESGDLNISLKNLSDYLFDLNLKLEISANQINAKQSFIENSTFTTMMNKPKLLPLLDEDFIMAA